MALTKKVCLHPHTPGYYYHEEPFTFRSSSVCFLQTCSRASHSIMSLFTEKIQVLKHVNGRWDHSPAPPLPLPPRVMRVKPPPFMMQDS